MIITDPTRANAIQHFDGTAMLTMVAYNGSGRDRAFSEIVNAAFDTSQRLGSRLVIVTMPVPEDRDEFSEIVAASWSDYMDAKYFNGSECPECTLIQLKMTGALVQALDIESQVEFLETENGRNFFLPTFKMLAVGKGYFSWPAWLLGSVDERIASVSTIDDLLPLNIKNSWHKHFRKLGGWSYVLKPFRDRGIFKRLDTPEFSELASIIDPASYVSRQTCRPDVYTGGFEMSEFKEE